MHKEHLNTIYAILNTLKLRFLPNTITHSNSLLPNMFSNVETADESYGYDWCLSPPSTIFQLYFDGQVLFWWRKQEDPEKTTNLSCRKSLTNLITLCCIECTLPWAGFELSTLVVMGTDCNGTIIDHCLFLGVVFFIVVGVFFLIFLQFFFVTSLFWLLCVV